MKRVAAEPVEFVNESKTCTKCGSVDKCKFKYLNNGKEDQPRYQCLVCKDFFSHVLHGRPKGKKYLKPRGKDPQELQGVVKTCTKCNAVNKAKFLYYNNRNLAQPRYQCLVCRQEFQLRLNMLAQAEGSQPDSKPDHDGIEVSMVLKSRYRAQECSFLLPTEELSNFIKADGLGNFLQHACGVERSSLKPGEASSSSLQPDELGNFLQHAFEVGRSSLQAGELGDLTQPGAGYVSPLQYSDASGGYMSPAEELVNAMMQHVDDCITPTLPDGSGNLALAYEPNDLALAHEFDHPMEQASEFDKVMAEVEFENPMQAVHIDDSLPAPASADEFADILLLEELDDPIPLDEIEHFFQTVPLDF